MFRAAMPPVRGASLRVVVPRKEPTPGRTGDEASRRTRDGAKNGSLPGDNVSWSWLYPFLTYDPVCDFGMRLHIPSNKRMSFMSFISFSNGFPTLPAGFFRPPVER
jgi:hypothetical protein